MLPNYKDGDFGLVLKCRVRAGDVVAVHLTDRGSGSQAALLKRIVALGGDTVATKNGKFYRNGREIRERQILGDTFSNWGDGVVVPEGCCCILGDNREYSIDSRDPEIGFVGVGSIVGRFVGFRGGLAVWAVLQVLFCIIAYRAECVISASVLSASDLVSGK